MRSAIYIIIVCLFFSTSLKSQNAIFLSQGRIEFERKVNLYAQVDDEDDDTWKDLSLK